MGLLANAAVLAADTQFRNMTLVALVYTGRTIIGENPATVNHDRRLWFANEVIANPTRYIDTIAWVIASDPTIAVATGVAQVNENDMLTSVATAWDYLSGIGVVRVGPN